MRGSRSVDETSENRRFDAGRFRGGRGYGSGSGSVIWERRKKNGIRLRSGIRFEINAASHSFKSFRQITPSHRRHLPALNTSSTSALHCFRTFCQQDGSPTNTDLLINSIDCYLEQCFFPIQVFHSVIFRESYIYIHLVSGVCADELFLEIIDITS